MLYHKNIRIFLLIVAGVLSFIQETLAGNVKVVTTTTNLAAIAKEIGGDKIDVESMSQASEDPHFVDPKPNLLLLLNKADVLLVNGLDLEIGWLPPLIRGARNQKIQVGAPGYFDASKYIVLQEIHTGAVDRSMGDIHMEGNPHFLLDGKAVIVVAQAFAKRLQELDKPNKLFYQQQSKKMTDELLHVVKTQREKFAKLPATKRCLVSYHQSLIYLLLWLDLHQVATVEPKPGISPDPGHVAEVLQTMRNSQCQTLVQEEYYPQHTSETLTKLANAKFVTIPGGVRIDKNQSYKMFLEQVTDKIYDAIQN